MRKLSRRHAVIALKRDQVYIEDLESSNGTFIGGKRLDERAQRLADGDTVMFGSEHFCYRVRVESDSEATRLAETLMVGPGLTVVSAANAGAPVAASRSAPAAASRHASSRECGYASSCKREYAGGCEPERARAGGVR